MFRPYRKLNRTLKNVMFFITLKNHVFESLHLQNRLYPEKRKYEHGPCTLVGCIWILHTTHVTIHLVQDFLGFTKPQIFLMLKTPNPASIKNACSSRTEKPHISYDAWTRWYPSYPRVVSCSLVIIQQFFIFSC